MKCLNKNVLIAIGALALVVVLLKPGWAAAALPLLILAVCPLSMFFMMRGMSRHRGTAAGDPRQPGVDVNREISALQQELAALKADQAHRSAPDAGAATTRSTP